MAKPYDATTKYLVERQPADWLAYVGLPVSGPVEVISPELSTITAEADHVLRVHGSKPWLAHLEFQSRPDPTMADRLLRYNILLRSREALPVASVVVLLAPSARHPSLTGLLEDRIGRAAPYLSFRYSVIRSWEQPVEMVLRGGVGTLPMAPLAAVERSDLPVVLRRIDQRLRREVPPETAKMLWAATSLLMGLRYPRHVVREVLGAMPIYLEDSSVYQEILERGREEGRVEGKVEEARAMLLDLGHRRFGPPAASTRAEIEATTDLERLQRAISRILDAAGWDELLAP